MYLLTHYRDAARESAERAWRAPIGWMSPLWMTYGAAVGAGAAWWWMSQLGRPANVEALHGVRAASPSHDEKPLVDKLRPAMAAETAVPEDEAAQRDSAAVEDMADGNEDALAALSDPKVEPATTADDLTRIVGIGPKLAAALAERGVTSFARIAAWTDQEIAEIDAALKLKGGVSRHAWVAQARRFAGRQG